MVLYERGIFTKYIPPYEKRNDRFSLNKLSERQKVEIFGVPRLRQTNKQTNTHTDKLPNKEDRIHT